MEFFVYISIMYFL